MKRDFKLFYALACLWSIWGLLFASLAGACDAQWYTTRGAALINGGDREAARREAVKSAGLAAIAKALADITLDRMLAGFHLNGNTASAIPFVEIEAAEILEEQETSGGATKEPPACMVKVKTALCRSRKDPAAGLRLSVSLNKPVFDDGEEMRMRILASRDCRYAVYIITEDQGVARLIPSRLKGNNVLKAGETSVFPSDKEMEKGIRLRAHVASTGAATTETLFVLALTKEEMESNEKMDEAIFGLYDGQTARLEELVSRIAVIPLKYRCEYLVRYAIVPKTASR